MDKNRVKDISIDFLIKRLRKALKNTPSSERDDTDSKVERSTPDPGNTCKEEGCGGGAIEPA